MIASVHREAGGTEVFKGFCKKFGDDLQLELRQSNPKTTVLLSVINNEYKGLMYPRWGSLITENPNDRKDLQCGPNSKQRIENDQIIFSEDNFYETGIKLLLKKETLAKSLANQSANSLEEQLKIIKSFRIGAVTETTTLEKLKEGGYYSYEYQTRDEVLDTLK